LKQYLKCYINYRQNDWVQLLSIAQLTYNSTITETISISSFYANYEFKSETFKKSRHFAQIVQKAIIQIKKLQLLHKKLQKNIQFLSKRFALYINKQRNKEFILKERNKVYLLWWNIKIKQFSNKLNHIKLRSFVIKTVKKSINYKLNLLSFMKIHSIFHIFFKIHRLRNIITDQLIRYKFWELD